PIQQRVTRISAELAQQAGGRIGIAGIQQEYVAIVGKGQSNREWGDPTGVIEFTDFPPQDNPAPELQMGLMDFDRGLPQQRDQGQGGYAKQSRSDPGGRPAKAGPG